MGEKPPEKGIIEKIKAIWLPVAGLMGAVTTVFQFVELWRGDQATVTWVVTGLGFAILLVSLSWVGFSREKLDNKIATLTLYRSRQSRYPKFHKLARIGLLVLALMAFVLGYLLHTRLLELENKLVVLIADLEGPDTQKYRFTEELIANLNYTFQNNSEVLIIPFGQAITEQQGSDVARKEGNGRRADLVIWGWYGITETNAKLTLHIENLNPLGYLPLASSEMKQINAPFVDINSFTLQRTISGQMTDLINNITGIIYFQAGDVKSAAEWLSKPIFQEETIINRANSLFYRGSAYAGLGEFEQAINDYGQAIQSDPFNPSFYINRGVAYYEIGEYEQAISDYNKAIELDPDNLAAHYNKGNAYLAFGQYSKAITSFDKTIELDPKYVKAFLGLGICYSYLGSYENAISAYEKAIKLDSDNAIAYLGRGSVYVSLEQFSLAINDFDRSIQLNPQQWDAYNNRGSAYASLGDFDKAISDYNEAIKLNPKAASAYMNRANTYLSLFEYELALNDYKRAVYLDPNNAMIHFNLGTLYASLTDYDKGIIEFNKTIELNPSLSIAYYNRGVLFTWTGKLKQAAIDFEVILDLPGNTDAELVNKAKSNLIQIYYQIGSLEIADQHYDQAIIYLNRSIEIDPSMKQAYAQRGIAYGMLNFNEEALNDVQKFLELSGNTELKTQEDIKLWLSSTYYNMGYSYFSQNNYERSIVFFNHALDYGPLSAKTYTARGTAYSKLGKYMKAISDFSKAISVDPYYADAYLSRGIIYAILGYPEQAKGDFRKVLEISENADSTSIDQAKYMLQELSKNP